MSLAASQEQYKFMSALFDEKSAAVRKIEREIDEMESRTAKPKSIAAEIEAAMSVIDQLPQLANDPENLAAIGKAFGLVNLRMFLRFKQVQCGKRVLNKLACGSLTFGATPAPISLYDGPTGANRIKSDVAATVAAGSAGQPDDVGDPRPLVSGVEGNSLGNVNRDDRI